MFEFLDTFIIMNRITKSFEMYWPFFAEFSQYVHITFWCMFMIYLEFMFLCWIAEIDHKFVMVKLKSGVLFSLSEKLIA